MLGSSSIGRSGRVGPMRRARSPAAPRWCWAAGSSVRSVEAGSETSRLAAVRSRAVCRRASMAERSRCWQVSMPPRRLRSKTTTATALLYGRVSKFINLICYVSVSAS